MIQECDRYGSLLKYDARRPTHPHASNPRAFQEGAVTLAVLEKINLRKLPKRTDPCPCGTPSIDVQYLDMEDGKPIIKTGSMPAPYRDCCEGLNWVSTDEQYLQELQREADEIVERKHEGTDQRGQANDDQPLE